MILVIPEDREMQLAMALYVSRHPDEVFECVSAPLGWNLVTPRPKEKVNEVKKYPGIFLNYV